MVGERADPATLVAPPGRAAPRRAAPEAVRATTRPASCGATSAPATSPAGRSSATCCSASRPRSASRSRRCSSRRAPASSSASTARGAPGSWFDRFLTLGAYLGVSFPVYWVGLLLILVFAVQLRWLPPSGSGGLAFLVLPALTLGMRSVAFLARMTRAAMQEVLQSDFVRTARAKGWARAGSCSATGSATRCCRSSRCVGLDFGSYLTGSILTETIFSWPGVGPLRAHRHRASATCPRSRAASCFSAWSSCWSTCSPTCSMPKPTRGWRMTDAARRALLLLAAAAVRRGRARPPPRRSRSGSTPGSTRRRSIAASGASAPGRRTASCSTAATPTGCSSPPATPSWW